MKPLDCTAIDLYAARCAVLHTLTSESDLSSQGIARRVAYSWGTAAVGNLKEVTKILKKDVVSIHINDLNEALLLGIDRYLDELGQDEARKTIVIKNAEKTYNDLPESVMNDFLSNSE